MHSEMRSFGINSVTSPISFRICITAQQHSAQQRVRNLIRARDSLTIELRYFLLVVIFARDDPTRLVLHGTGDVDRTLLLLELLHFSMKIHRLHLIALDRCEWPRTSPNSRAVGLRPSSNFVKHVIFGSLCTLWTFFPNH